MKKIQIIAPDEVSFYSLHSAAFRALLFTVAIPETEECAALVTALEAAADAHAEAAGKVKEIDAAEAEYKRQVDREAQASVDEGRAPKALKKPDFDEAREKAEAMVKARLGAVLAARRSLDTQAAADSELQAAKDAARVPELYSETLGAVQAARASFARLLEARDAWISQLGGNPDYVVRSLPWHGPVNEALDAVEKWLTAAADPINEPTIDVRDVEPSMQIRKQMAQAGDLDALYNVEFAEGFAVSEFTRGHQPALIASYDRH
ncbi:hypothetical protein V2J52_02805 [Georgenia sp. MJ173]|uniref:hypothetical protein n=1 Tax=Georgenia sunbinii TaxID=3117728 RepID=UPI002F26A864